MAARKVYDVAVRTGSYKDREGNDKSRFENIGSVMKGDDGNFFMLMKRTFNPAGVPTKNPGDDNILVSMFTPRDDAGGRAAGGQRGGGGGAGTGGVDDNVPF